MHKHRRPAPLRFPRPKPASVQHINRTALLRHIDNLQILTLRMPDFVQAVFQATEKVARKA